MLSLLLILTISINSAISGQLETVFEWKHIDFVWDSPHQRNQAILTGLYNPRHIMPLDFDRAAGS